ncbi:hypothetical protein OI450_14315 [Pectobacterium cacticida]|uniref:Uncharacterized protein n=1 Tax=Pectobacterium cacticida TaxID=69221 RepID=A0ABZ2GCG0_9GAMM|nr:hypothetical protein [Pectobacterium cacticida]UYX06090.1 hypothetical protein OI450_14315 [Pectobacterium cacticida]
MKTINDTRLEVIGFGSVPAGVDEQREMARELISLRTQLAELRGQDVFMYGIADPDGNAYFDECCVGDAGLMGDEVARLNDDLEDGDPLYSVVELFCRPVPSVASQPYVVPDEMLETPDEDAEIDAYNKGKTDGWNAYRTAMLHLVRKDGDA